MAELERTEMDNDELLELLMLLDRKATLALDIALEDARLKKLEDGFPSGGPQNQWNRQHLGEVRQELANLRGKWNSTDKRIGELMKSLRESLSA